MQFATRLATQGLARDGLKMLALSALLGLYGCSDSNSVTDPNAANTDTETVDELDNSENAADANTDNPPNVDADTPPPVPGGTVSTTEQARYRLTFNATWSDATHPVNFPGNPHFSGLVGAVHNEQIRFWEPAQIATPGIQLMAETGSKSGLLAEVQTAIIDGSAIAAIDGGGVGTSPGTTSIEFDVSRDYPEISVTSMLAPSPDWFIGLHNYSLIADDEFIESATIELSLYDSGSDNGVRYTSANDATDPLAPIATVLSDPLDTPFVNGTPSVGSFVIERLSVE